MERHRNLTPRVPPLLDPESTFNPLTRRWEAPDPIQTNVVFVTVKIDARKSEAAGKALEVIESALQSFYGGEHNGWHGWVTNNGKREQSISLEGAHL
jgi:hypothetical protein